MAKLKLKIKIFNKLVDLLIRNKTQTFINYFNDGCCKNINFKCKFELPKFPSSFSTTKTTILFVAGYYRNIEAMKCLIKNGANINAEVESSGYYKYNSNVFNELCSIMRLRYANYCDIYEQHDVDDYTFMKFCLENGANPNLKIRNFMSSFKTILSYAKEDIIELFINYGANVYDFYVDNTSILKKLIYNQKLKLEPKLALINKIKRSYTDHELYELSKKISNSNVPDKDDITKELDTIESNGKSAAKIKIA